VTARSAEQGFTMIEVMVAILLTAIAVIGVVALFRVQTSASSFSRHSTEATVLAGDKMEALRTEGIPASGSDSNLDALGHTGGIYSRVWTVTTGSLLIDYKVTTTWNEDGINRTVTLVSKRTK